MDKTYQEHPVFEQLSDYAEFYEDLAIIIMGWVTQGTTSIINIDTYVYSSIQGTLESIKDILIKGRINDVHALLREYQHSTITVTTSVESLCYYRQPIQLQNTRQRQMPSLISSCPITKSTRCYSSTRVRVAKRLAIVVLISLCLPSQIRRVHH